MIELRPLTDSDVDAHNAGEDDAVVTWLTGGRATVETTRRHFAQLSANAASGKGKRGFGVWLDDRLAGYVDFDPEADFLPSASDVNIAYAVHPWARRRGVATASVLLVCERIADDGLADRSIIRADPRNSGSIGVAARCGFQLIAAAGPAQPCATYALDLRHRSPQAPGERRTVAS